MNLPVLPSGSPAARRPRRPDARVALRGDLALAWLCAALLAAAALPWQARAEPPVQGAAESAYELEISKSSKELLVKRGSRVEKRFRVALGGGGPGDKRQRGDSRTPVGTYRIVDFNEESRFQLFMHLNYPNVKDAFFGYKSQLISRGDFDRIVAALKRDTVPPQDTALGGAIGIHGIGEADEEKMRIHRSQDWTEGCIALTNSEILELRRYVGVGTKVTINE